MTILLVAVVDDEEPVRKALVRLLRASGLDAHSFASGPAFLESIQIRRPSCLVLDLHMPGMSGLEILDRLREFDRPLPTIVITGHDEPENEARCYAAGAKAFMRKPVDDYLLLDSIDQAIGGRGPGP